MNKKRNLYILILLIIAFLAIAIAVKSQSNFIVGLDNNVATFTEKIHSPALDGMILSLTKLGNTYETIFIFAIFALFLILKRKKYLFYVFTAVSILGVALNEIIKLLVERARPISHLLLENDFSFPSGHATISVIFLLSSIFLIAPNIKNRFLKIIFIIISSIVFSLVALSRIYLSVHFASDVIAGLLLGSVCFLLAKIITSKFSNVV